MLTLDRITQRANDDQVDSDVVERDYVLTQVMASLALHPDNGVFQFKGGTSLRLCYFPEYRYSADIDLNVEPEVPQQRRLDILREVLETAQERLGLPHLELLDGEHLRIAYIGPKRTAKPRQVKVDIADDEIQTGNDTTAVLLARYEDQPETLPIRIYSLTEVTAEKLRCVMQRLQCRDLFDLWFLLENGGVDAAEVKPDFETKARHRGFDPSQFPDRFVERVEEYRRRWSTELTPYMADLPDVGQVVRVVTRHLRQASYLR
jgi:predicted nucleotidyltransferase component of viral defense system